MSLLQIRQQLPLGPVERELLVALGALGLLLVIAGMRGLLLRLRQTVALALLLLVEMIISALEKILWAELAVAELTLELLAER